MTRFFRRRPFVFTLSSLAAILWLAFFGACAAGMDGSALAAPTSEAKVDEPTSAGDEPAPLGAEAWGKVQAMMKDGRNREALEEVNRLLAVAREEGDARAWARALFTSAQLTSALSGPETAISEFRQAERPADPTFGAVLDVVYGTLLRNYWRAYSWQIQQRESIGGDGGAGDLPAAVDTWSAQQLAGEIHRAFARSWQTLQDGPAFPIGELDSFFTPSNYPEGLRDRLQDAVAYMGAEVLADSALWTAAQNNELFLVDLKQLLADDLSIAETELATAHPIVRSAARLGELEAWHLAKSDAPDRRGAVLEARLQRFRTLGQSFSEDDDREALLRALNRTIEEFQDSPWIDWAYADRADLVRLGGDLEVAHKLASDCADGEAGQASLGNQRCRAIRASIEAPSFELMSMISDGFDRRSIAIRHSNLSRLYFRAFREPLPPEIRSLNRRNQDLPRLVGPSANEPAVEMARWTVDLPPTPDFRPHRTYVVPPLDDKTPGFYRIEASAREDFSDKDNRIVSVNLTMGDLVLATQGLDDHSVEVRALAGGSGEPRPDTRLRLYRFSWDRNRASSVRPVEVDSEGMAVLPVDTRRGRWVLTGEWVDESGNRHVAATNNLYPSHRQTGEPSTAALVVTDRAIYRPGQKLQFKVTLYRSGGLGGPRRRLAERPVTVTLTDPNGQSVAEAKLTSNSFGTASGEMSIPTGRPLGSWGLSVNDRIAWQPVRVEEYKRPSFEAEIADADTPPRLNQAMEVAGEARYYFGLPVSEGRVVWKVRRVPQFPWWWSWRLPPGGGATQTIAGGETVLDAEGRFTLGFTPLADERLKESGVTYSYQIEADITDSAGETSSAARTFRLGFVGVEADVTLAKGFVRAGTAPQISIERRDLDGHPRSGSGQWRLERLIEPSTTRLPSELPVDSAGDSGFGGQMITRSSPASNANTYRTQGDKLRPRWESLGNPDLLLARWSTGEQVAGATVEHGVDGKAEPSIPTLRGGAYRLTYTTRDSEGETFEVAKNFLVADDQSLSDSESRPSLALVLKIEEPSVSVGGVARLLVASGLPGRRIRAERLRDGQRVEETIVEGGAIIEYPIEPEDRGGFLVRARTLADHQWMSFDQVVTVPWDDKKLLVSFETFRDRLRPGSRETLRLKVASADGSPVESGAAEVLASMYDRSLDVFAEHSPARLFDRFPDRSWGSSVSTTLGAFHGRVTTRNRWFELPASPQIRGTALKFDSRLPRGPGAGGPMRFRAGSAPVDMAMAESVPSTAQGLITVTSEAPLLEEKLVQGRGQGETADPPALRSDFSETALWAPHLVTDDDGSVAVEIDVPDSVTAWKIWAQALDRDLDSGWAEMETRTIKELLVRPYLPRFLRQGDQAKLEVKVDNASESRLAGQVRLEIIDPRSQETLNSEFGLPAEATASFSVAAGSGSTVAFALMAPRRLGDVAFRVTAEAGGFSDGELRPLPILPSRIALSQSRTAVVREGETDRLRFDDLATDDDPTRIDESLVVAVDAQLFSGILAALPYLVDYPYECTEQTLNRFVSTGILTSLFDRYPAVAKLAADLADRETRYESWDADDPNRRLALEETPWLQTADGGSDDTDELLRVLDPGVSRAQRERSLAKLRDAQHSSGAFPWWPGGPPSDYMTAYILGGLAKAAELGVDVPKDVVQRAWNYLARRWRDEYAKRLTDKGSDALLILMNFVATTYPDPSWMGDALSAEERVEILDHTFERWRDQSPLLKSLLTLTLERMQRHDDAVLILASVMDGSLTTELEGTFWRPEPRAWLWYNDTIEGHALALRALMEISPEDERIHGLVQWLFLNKKLGHWQSTRATAEVLYSVAAYLEKEDALGKPEAVTIEAADRSMTFRFDPETFTGKGNRLVIPGPALDSSHAEIEVSKEGPGMAFATATWHFTTEELPAAGDGDLFRVEREYFLRQTINGEARLFPLRPGTQIALGDEVEVELRVRALQAAEFVHLRDPRPAGFEPSSPLSGYRWDLGIGHYREIRDSGANFFFDWLPAGEVTLRHRLRAATAGTFAAQPTTLQSMYAPEFTAYSAGESIEVGID